MLEMKIPQLVLDIIMLCVSTPSMRIIWNGELTNAFHPARGIRQGDAFSSYLFVMCMERLNHLIEEAVNGGSFEASML